jgi:hypothetical protein
MPMYSGDEEVSDAESVDEDSEYDHEFEPTEVCENCGTDTDNCDCEEDEQDFQEQDECAICGEGADEPIHVEV